MPPGCLTRPGTTEFESRHLDQQGTILPAQRKKYSALLHWSLLALCDLLAMYVSCVALFHSRSCSPLLASSQQWNHSRGVTHPLEIHITAARLDLLGPRTLFLYINYVKLWLLQMQQMLVDAGRVRFPPSRWPFCLTLQLT